MVTINQVQKGFARFVDTQLSGAFTGWQKAVVIGGGTLLAANLPKLLTVYGTNPMVAALGIFHPETGQVDIDALYTAFVPNLGTEKIPVSIPTIGIIKLGQEEFDILCRYIKEA